MGNSSTKEQRQPPLGSASHSENVRYPHSRSVSENGALPSPSPHASSSDSTTTAPVYSTRHGRSSRPDLSFLGIGHSADRDIAASLESRRETKQEREARRLERERVAREKERERSMKFESVDGGYLVTQGVYTGSEDFNKPIVRHLMIERRLAPFFKGLNDHSSSWTDDQLVAAAKGQPVTTGSSQPAEDASRPDEMPALECPTSDVSTSKPIGPAVASRSPSPLSDSSVNISPAQGVVGLATFAGVPHAAAATTTTTGATLAAPPPFRPRSKTLASLTGLAKNHSQDEMTPQEIHLPKNPLIEGRPLEAFLYRNAAECPICFLYYPPYLNRTRCCDQPICSECFVQIKRPDPHPPEHADPGASTNGADASRRDDPGELLVSEPAACPFCVQPELGVTYDPPPFRSGLTYANHVSMHAHATSAMSSSSSLASVSGPSSGPFGAPLGVSRRRTTSISATSPNVVTTDRIRPDWAQKLANARAHAARRSAAATALHTAAYLMGGFSGSESRSFAGFGRRRLVRGARSETAEASTSGRRRTDSDPLDRDAQASSHDEHSPAGREGRSSRRRPRLEDLEEMMMMEAIRLSIASEEERKRKEEAENQQRQLEASAASAAATSRNRPELFRNKTSGGGQPSRAVEGRAGDENSTTQQRPSAAAKGKSVDRSAAAPTIDAALLATSGSAALASTLSSAQEWESLRQPSSHSVAPAAAASGLGTAAPASAAAAVGMPPPSSSSSDTGYGGGGTSGSPTRPGSFRAESVGGKSSSASGTGTPDEPMLNFSSLAAMVGHDESTDRGGCHANDDDHDRRP